MKEISLEELLAGVELRKSLIAQLADYEAHPERGIDITDMSHEDRLTVVRDCKDRRGMMIDREKVRQALFDSMCETALDANCLALQSGRLFFDGDCDANALADAAIASVLEQLREPSEAMYEAGADTMDEQGNYEGSPAAIWQAMLESAFLQPPDSSNPAE